MQQLFGTKLTSNYKFWKSTAFGFFIKVIHVIQFGKISEQHLKKVNGHFSTGQLSADQLFWIQYHRFGWSIELLVGHLVSHNCYSSNVLFDHVECQLLIRNILHPIISVIRYLIMRILALFLCLEYCVLGTALIGSLKDLQKIRNIAVSYAGHPMALMIMHPSWTMIC